MTSRTLTYGRVFDVEAEHAFDATLALPLQTLFADRCLAIPPIKDVREQVGAWSSPGQTRRLVLADGGTMLEELITVEPQNRFTYRITELTGALKPLVDSIDGTWEFLPAGTGTRVVWSWDVHPRGRLGTAAMPVFARMWSGYAAKGFDNLGKALQG